MAAPVVIFLASEGFEARYQAAMVALTAAALGDEVHLALSAGALRAWVEGRFGEGAPPQARAARVPPLDAALDEGRRDLGIRVVACDTAVRLAGLEPERVRPRLDGVVSLPSLWKLAQSGRALSF